MQYLDEAYKHALTAREIETEIESLNLCLQQTENSQSKNPLCNSDNFSLIQKEIDLNIEHLAAEKELGQGLLADSSAALVETAAVPGSPVLYGRNSMIFFGALIGLLLGFTFVLLIKR